MPTDYDKLDELWERLNQYGTISRDYKYSRWNLRQIDLRGQDFSDIHFPSQCDFEQSLLQEANFEGSFLNGANFMGSKMSKANFRKAKLFGSNLSYCDLSYSILSEVSLRLSKMAYADFTGALLANSDLCQSDFSFATLRHCDCSFCDMYRAKFLFADLSDANFSGADVSLIELKGAITRGLLLKGCHQKKRYFVPVCRNCGDVLEMYEGEFDDTGLQPDERISRCFNCFAELTVGDIYVKVVGTDSTEVTKVIKEVRSMQSKDVVTINISGGQIGNLNLGKIIGDLEANLTSIRKEGGEDVALALKRITEIILISEKLQDHEKSEVTEQIEELANQANKPEKERKIGIVRSILASLGAILSTIQDTAPVWSKTVDLLRSFFGI